MYVMTFSVVLSQWAVIGVWWQPYCPDRSE